MVSHGTKKNSPDFFPLGLFFCQPLCGFSLFAYQPIILPNRRRSAAKTSRGTAIVW